MIIIVSFLATCSYLEFQAHIPFQKSVESDIMSPHATWKVREFASMGYCMILLKYPWKAWEKSMENTHTHTTNQHGKDPWFHDGT